MAGLLSGVQIDKYMYSVGIQSGAGRRHMGLWLLDTVCVPPFHDTARAASGEC